MKKVLLVFVGLASMVYGCQVVDDEGNAPELTDSYFFRGNGTASGTLDFNKDIGTLQAGSSGVDTIYDIQYSDFGPDYNFSVVFKRKGDYSQTYYAWVSFDKEQITGYYENMNQRLPFTASLADEIVYSEEEQTDINGEWDLRCDGIEYGILFLNDESGYIEMQGSGKDNISDLISSVTGDMGAIELMFIRTGNPDLTYHGWISSDKKQMSGYYVNDEGTEELPFYAYKK